MKAVGYKKSQTIGNIDSLEDIELPTPEAKGRDLLVNVKAISVNPVDTKIRMSVNPKKGEYKVLGWDAVGEVVGVGEDVKLFNINDRVWYAGDITRPGCNAEYQLVDERIVGNAPTTLCDAEAAAMPLTTITAWELLFDRLLVPLTTDSNEQSKARILIVGASGGVGSVLIQLATKLTNATVIGSASREETKTWVKQCGADYVVDHSKPLSEELKRVGIDNVSHAISLTHTDQHYNELVECLAAQGKLALIDDPIAPIDIIKLKKKSISLHWELMFTRSMFQTEDIIEQHNLLDKVAELVDVSVIKSTLKDRLGSINAVNLKQAHANIESHKTIGKIVLEGF